MRMNPASPAPTIAPIVFAAYNRPNDALSSSAWSLRWRVRVGSVAPMRIVAGPRASSASTNRTSASASGAVSSEPNAPR